MKPKQAKEPLQLSEELFRLLVEGVQDYAVFIIDPQGRVSSWNTGAERIKGYKASEIIGKHFSCFYPDEDAQSGKPEQALDIALRNGHHEGEGWRIRKDGSRFWANVITTAMRGDKGHLQGFSKVTCDLTERKHAVALLQKANDRIEMILDSITDRFFGFDNEWRFTGFNKHGAEQLRVLGKDPASLIGKVLWDVFPNPPTEEVFHRAMRERVAITHEHYYPPLGEWVENRIYPSLDGGLAIFQRYITERKRGEQEMRRSEAYLAEGQRMSHTGSWAWNVSTREFFWSLEHFRICGLVPGDFKPTLETAEQLIHPEDRLSTTRSGDQGTHGFLAGGS